MVRLGAPVIAAVGLAGLWVKDRFGGLRASSGARLSCLPDITIVRSIPRPTVLVGDSTRSPLRGGSIELGLPNPPLRTPRPVGTAANPVGTSLCLCAACVAVVTKMAATAIAVPTVAASPAIVRMVASVVAPQPVLVADTQPDVRTPIIERVVVVVAKEGMVVKTAVVPMQAAAVPADAEGGSHPPERPVGKEVTARIRVVVDRIGTRVVVINAPWLIGGNFQRVVIGHMNHLPFHRRDFYGVVLGDRDGLFVVAFKVPRHLRLLAEFGDGGDHIPFLHNDRRAEFRGPRQVS